MPRIGGGRNGSRYFDDYARRHDVLFPVEAGRHGQSHVDPKLFWFANGDPRFVAALSHAFSKNDQNDFMHNKVMVINNKTVVTGRYNFSEMPSIMMKNMVIIESPVIAAAYTRYFDALFSSTKRADFPCRRNERSAGSPTANVNV